MPPSASQHGKHICIQHNLAKLRNGSITHVSKKRQAGVSDHTCATAVAPNTIPYAMDTGHAQSADQHW
ncbi:hypothetical protein DPMN_180560 [Dreissena polymorpha]|uniref:Uncharacterized protein n=1 Tax=Dreissena polymorpha TaxID=45954 RepID=A0A9D4EIB0_DREPO|nr:hypothetical protein DPMN_180560 [Dreissena polymorpha]